MKRLLLVSLFIISVTFGKPYILSKANHTFQFVQSTQQAFYFIQNVDGISKGDVLIAYKGDDIVGFREWTGEITDVPAMGYDGTDNTKDYMKAGEIPSFRLLKNGELIELEGDGIQGWGSNQIIMISNLYEKVEIPQSYSLDKPYPNPFNPSTTISFSLPTETNVLLTIYNLKGREITTLLNNNYSSGYHSVIWDASNYASGVYFVKMVAGEYNNTQKLELVK